MPYSAPASTPARSGSGRAAALPRDAGRATEVLYDRHGDTVFRYAWHLLGRREDAEDATQATFLAVHSALAGGTAVLEPGAWVIRIARNECMGRLRTTARAPALGVLGADLDPAAEGGVESAAELRDEMRTARRTLSALPEAEREAFVLREWIGLETGEVARALGVSAGDVDDLAARARRSLVLAVGGLEPAMGCAATRAALEAGSLDRAGKVHLLRCPVCRGVRRALRPREVALASFVPGAIVAERLAVALPGFGGGAGGGGIIAALTAKATAAPFVAKAAAVLAAALLAGGAAEQAVRSSHPAHQRSSAAVFGRGGEAPAPAVPGRDSPSAPVAPAAAGETPRRSSLAHATTSAVHPVNRGGAAEAGESRGSESEAPGSASGERADDTSAQGDAGDGGHAAAGDDDKRTSVASGSSSGEDRSPGSAGESEQEMDSHSGERSRARSAEDTAVSATPATPEPATSGSDHGDAGAEDGHGDGSGDSATTDTSGGDGGDAPPSGDQAVPES